MADVDLPRSKDLPGWMQALRDRYLTTDIGQFILHGNVHDVVLGAGQIWSMPDFLDAFFAPSGKLVVHYDPGRGVFFRDAAQAAKAATLLIEAGFISEAKLAPRGLSKTPQALLGQALSNELSIDRSSSVILPVLEALLVRRDTPCALILHYAELIAPNGDPAQLSFEDRTAAATLHRWSLWEQVVRADNLVLLLTNSVLDLARRLSRNPRVASLRLPLPDSVARARFLARRHPALTPERGEQLTRVTAGLQLRQIEDLMSHPPAARPTDDPPTEPRQAFADAAPLPLEAVTARKKEILEQECFGLIEVIEPDHDFSVVGGMEPIKRALLRVADHVRAGKRAQVPIGILLVGPMGTGKSFVAEAFARESGLAALRLKNFRDKWVGSTEANLEKVLDVIEALGEILVIVDEGDRSIGGGSGDSDGGVNARVIARLKEFMSDPSHRGRVIFVMMTNRPDKLDTDMKRPGRFDLKIPFFPPQNVEERAAIVRALIRRHGLPVDLPDELLRPALEGLEGYGAADLEAMLLLAYDDFEGGPLPEGLAERPARLTVAFLEQAAADYLPTRETDMIEYMELLAVYEASNRRLLPPRYRAITVEDLSRRLADARRRALRR